MKYKCNNSITELTKCDDILPLVEFPKSANLLVILDKHKGKVFDYITIIKKYHNIVEWLQSLNYSRIDTQVVLP